jgi:hypothetical protein
MRFHHTRVLEFQPKSELHHARVAGEPSDGACGAAAEVAVRKAKLHCVGQVEDLPAEFEYSGFMDWEFPVHGEIEDLGARSPQDVATRVPELPGLLQGECIRRISTPTRGSSYYASENSSGQKTRGQKTRVRKLVVRKLVSLN